MKRSLTSRQRQFLDALFSGDGDEAAVLQTLGIMERTYRRWLGQQAFLEELAHRVCSTRRRWQLLLARYSPTAAARLIDLTAGDKPETARKACLDVLTLQQRADAAVGLAEPQQTVPAPLDPDVAARMLSILAGEQESGHASGIEARREADAHEPDESME